MLESKGTSKYCRDKHKVESYNSGMCVYIVYIYGGSGTTRHPRPAAPSKQQSATVTYVDTAQPYSVSRSNIYLHSGDMSSSVIFSADNLEKGGHERSSCEFVEVTG